MTRTEHHAITGNDMVIYNNGQGSKKSAIYLGYVIDSKKDFLYDLIMAPQLLKTRLIGSILEEDIHKFILFYQTKFRGCVAYVERIKIEGMEAAP